MKPKIKLEKNNALNSSKNSKMYDETHQIEKLEMLCIIVARHQGDYFIDQLMNNKIGAAFLVYGTGTATKEIYDLLGIGDTKKDIVLSLVKEGDKSSIINMINNRFAVSKKAKGIAFFAEINSLAGVLLYKFFANRRDDNKKE